MHEVLINIAILIIIATIFAYIARLLKQPIIPAYILAGILLGPLGIKQIQDTNLIFAVSEIGIAFLLFIVGLEMSYKRFKNVGKNAVAVGISSSLILMTLGYVLAIFFGFIKTEAVYIGLSIAFGSTMVVLKLLSDSEELKSLHGRLMIGILLTEDIIVIIALMILKNLHNLEMSIIFLSILKAIIFIIGAFVFAKFVIPKIFSAIAKYQDFLFLGSLSWFFLLVLIANYIHFSIAIGAFIAGISLASTPYNLEIIGKVKHLKDFFTTLFFTCLGMLLIPFSKELIIPVIILISIVLFFKPLYMYWLLHFSYHKKSAFLAGTGLAQISEFSLVIATTGLMLNHISQQIFSIIVVIAVITMSITPYIFKYNRSVYNRLSKYKTFKDNLNLENLPKDLNKHVILCGSHRTGCEVIKELQRLKQKFVVIDYDPEIIKELLNKKIKCIYGDITDLEILNKVKLDKAKAVISTIPYIDENLFLLKVLKLVNKKSIFLSSAKDVNEAAELYTQGADYVIVPHTAGGEKLALVFKEFLKHKNKIKKIKKQHISNIKGKKSILDLEDPFSYLFLK